jgi:effector-binding domain-containing protein
MPVGAVAEVVNTADLHTRNALIAHHLDRLQGQLSQTQAAVNSLRELLAPSAPPIEVEFRSERSTVAAAIRATVGLDELLGWYGDAMDDLVAALARHDVTPTGPPAGLYSHELFADERGDVVVFVPVDQPPADGRVQPIMVPASDLAVAVHRGPHDDIDITYGKLGSYVAQHALAVDGPLRETYFRGPRDTSDPLEWHTEIGWPVFRTSVAD